MFLWPRSFFHRFVWRVSNESDFYKVFGRRRRDSDRRFGLGRYGRAYVSGSG